MYVRIKTTLRVGIDIVRLKIDLSFRAGVFYFNTFAVALVVLYLLIIKKNNPQQQTDNCLIINYSLLASTGNSGNGIQ